MHIPLRPPYMSSGEWLSDRTLLTRMTVAPIFSDVKAFKKKTLADCIWHAFWMLLGQPTNRTLTLYKATYSNRGAPPKIDKVWGGLLSSTSTAPVYSQSRTPFILVILF